MELDSYADTGVVVAVELVNALTPPHAEDPMPALRRILSVDPPSLTQLTDNDAPSFVTLAERLRGIVEQLDRGDVDTAADGLNALLAAYPAAPHLAKENGQWRLHHHPTDLPLVPMWSSICAEAVARMVGGGHHDRLGICEAPHCGRAYVDLSKNASRRFCSTACQNRVKSAAFRQRRR